MRWLQGLRTSGIEEFYCFYEDNNIDIVKNAQNKRRICTERAT